MISVFVNSGTHPHPVPVTFVFGGGLIVGYYAFRAIVEPPFGQPGRAGDRVEAPGEAAPSPIEG